MSTRSIEPRVPLSPLAFSIRVAGFAVVMVLAISPLLLVEGQLLQLALAAVIFTGVLAGWAKFVDRTGIEIYGLGGGRLALVDFTFGLVAGALAVAVMFAASLMVGDLNHVELNAMSSVQLWAFLRPALVGYWEEAFFRGFLCVLLFRGVAFFTSETRALVVAALASSLLFAAAHAGTDYFSLAPFILLAVNGLVWVVAAWVTGRVWLAVGMHASWNYAQLYLFGFAMSGNESSRSWLTADVEIDAIWSGGAYGPEGGALGLVGFAVMLLAAGLYSRIGTSDDRMLIRRLMASPSVG